MKGAAFAIVAQLVYAITLLVVNRKLVGLSPVVINFSLVLIGSLALLPTLFFIRRDVSNAVRKREVPWQWLIAGSVVWITASQTLWVFGAQLAEAHLVALTALFFPVFVTIFELALGKAVDARFGIGFFLMAAGFVIILLRSA